MVTLMPNDKSKNRGGGQLGNPVWAFFARRIMPLILLAAGTSSIIYGSIYHAIPISETSKEETSIPAPDQFQNGPQNGQNSEMSDSENGGVPAVPIGPPPTIKVFKTTTTTTPNPESKIILDVTIGGVTLDEDGKIVRTYSGTKGPGFCPT